MKRTTTFLLAMLFGLLFGLNASASTTWNFTIDIDNPAAVNVSYNGSSISLHEGVNNLSVVDDNGYGASVNISCVGDYVFTSFIENGEEQTIWDNKSLYPYVNQQNSAYIVRTANLNDMRTSSVTINIDDAAGAAVMRNGDSNALSLTNGSNAVWFNPDTETPFIIRHISGSSKALGSVKLNDKEIDFVQYTGYTVTPSNGDVIDIVTYNPNAVRYSLSFASGSNLAAISSIEVGGRQVTGWENGSILIEEGEYGYIYFDNDNYEISDLVVDGSSQTYYGYPVYFYMDGNKTVSFTATSKGDAQEPTYTATFRLEGWEGNSNGNNVCINKGTSKWDTPLSFDSSYFTDSFTEESQSYFIYTEGDYRISSIKKMHGGNTSNVAVYEGGTPVTLSDGDAVDITVYKYVDLYTATLNISADLKNYDGDVFISNESEHVNKQQIYQGTNEVKFNPNDSQDRNFTLSSGSTDLYSVKLNGNKISGSNGIYNLGYLSDGAQVEIIAADPTYVKPGSTLVFDNDNNKAAIARMLVNGEDLPSSVWLVDGSYDAHIGDYFIVYFNKGYTITDFVFGENTYNYNPNITTPQPLDFNEEIYIFGHAIDEGYMAVSFTATAVSGPSYSYNVTFNVNIAGGVKVTDVSDSQNPVVVPVSGTSYTHTFTSEYNYVNIESAEGYDLESVTINPNNGNDSYSPTPSDNKVNSVMVEDNYIITIKVKKAASEEPSNPYGTATVNVIGSPSQFTFMNGSTNATIAMTSGINSLELYAESSTYNIMPVGDGIESVTLNGTEVSPLTIPFTYYSLTGVTRDAQIVITTVGGSSTDPVVPASFTMNISGSMDKISYLMDESYNRYTLGLGENTINLPNNTDTFQFLLSAEEALYSVKVNNVAVNGSYGGTTYFLSLKGGDVVDVETDFPNVDVDINWSFSGCDSSIITGIRVGGGDQTKYTAEDDEFADYLDGFSVPMGANVEYWLDTTNFTLTSVMHNDKSELTSEYHVFAPSGNTTIVISAAQKRIYNYTLSTNDPEHLVVYPGTSTVSQPIELTGNDTQLEVNEVTGNTCITIVPKYGYYFDEDNCTLDGVKMLKNTEGYYTVYPEENSVVRITITEVDRPEVAALYIDSFDNIEYVALTQNRYQAFSTDEDGLVAGYHVFHFNTTDLGTDGLTLNFRMKEEGAVPVIYVNNVAQDFNAESCQLSNLKLEDGDVIKIFGTQPTQHAITFVPNAGSNEFVITIDRINEFNDGTRIAAPARIEPNSNGSVSALAGTEISFTPSATVNKPWVKVDDNFVNIEPGLTHTVVVSGDHSISYGKDSIMAGIDGVIQTIVGSGNADIYNLQGVCIKRNATGSDLKSLKPGIYVIGGQKVFVK